MQFVKYALLNYEKGIPLIEATDYLLPKCHLEHCFSSSDYIAPNDRVIGEKWTGKDVEENCCLISVTINICLEELRKTTKTCQDGRLLDWDFNLGLHEYESGMVTTWEGYSVEITLVQIFTLWYKHITIPTDYKIFIIL
jgi:hypothetical protein